MKLETQEEKDAFDFLTELASQATDRICNDLPKEWEKKFEKLRVRRQEQDGKEFMDPVKYDFDIVQWLKERTKDPLEKYLDDKLPEHSLVTIAINTKFKPQLDEDGDEYTEQVVKDFHNAVHYLIEKYITDNDNFEGSILEILGDRGELSEKVKEFGDFGNISIRIAQEVIPK